MQKWLKTAWIVITVINLLALIWFVLGSTANFQRGIDLITTVIYILVAFPSTLLIVLSSILIYRNWNPIRWWEIVIVCGLSIAMFSLTPILFKSVNTSGWLTENIKKDSVQMTADNHFKYCIELVNVFQKNSSARLFIKNTETFEELRIPLKLPTNEIVTISWDSENYFVYLEPTANQYQYILSTTKAAPFPERRFEINVRKGTALEIE